MHEYAITSLIIEEILNLNEIKEVTKITKVTLGFGPFSHATFDRIQFWWEYLTEDTIFYGSELIYQEIPGELYCPNCKKNSLIKNRNSIDADDTLLLFACPYCQSLQTEIKSGTDITIINIEVEELKD